MSLVKINDIDFKYKVNEKNVFTDVNIEIDKGESVAIVGQNGAGKTTLVKMLNGLLRPTKGDVLIGEMNTKEHSTAELSKKVGYVFQNPDDQIFHDNVYDEMAFGPQKAQLDDEKIDDIVTEIAKICELHDSLEENPYDLPYSIRKFVATASILTMDSEVVILDEPTAGQDKNGMRIIKNIIEYLLSKNKTVITITHDMEFTVDNFKRVIVMSQGKKLDDDKPEEIFWNLDLLRKAQLQQPYVSRVARKVKLQSKPINVQKFADFIEEYYKVFK